MVDAPPGLVTQGGSLYRLRSTLYISCVALKAAGVSGRRVLWPLNNGRCACTYCHSHDFLRVCHCLYVVVVNCPDSGRIGYQEGGGTGWWSRGITQVERSHRFAVCMHVLQQCTAVCTTLLGVCQYCCLLYSNRMACMSGFSRPCHLAAWMYCIVSIQE